jgi:hypothetical protein
MIRVPELKKQAALLEAEIAAAMQSPLQHSVALEIVAKLNGYKNWRHAASQPATTPASEKVQVAAPAQKIELAVVFGTEFTSQLEYPGVIPENLDTFTLKTFDTEAEKQAYLEGISDMDGWASYSVVEDPIKAFLTEFAPGEDVVAIRELLAAHKFLPSDYATEEFFRDVLLSGQSQNDDPAAYQFIIFQKDSVTGERFINMDCAMHEGGEYLTETPLFKGRTILEGLQHALAAASAQREQAVQAAQEQASDSAE